MLRKIDEIKLVKLPTTNYQIIKGIPNYKMSF